MAKSKPIEHMIDTDVGNIFVSKKEYLNMKEIYDTQHKLTDDGCYELAWKEVDTEYPNEIYRAGHIIKWKKIKEEPPVVDVKTAFEIVAKICAGDVNKVKELSNQIESYKKLAINIKL